MRRLDTEPALVAFTALPSAKALAAGMRCRPVAETVADSWGALNDGGHPRPKYVQGMIPVGLEKDKHDAVPAAWDARG
ncbi:hypothetical protein [Streptomyces sp. NPDC091268]|uniref:hypothetical protein n=1 Tax=Streptomyces sp. NPDC091268 TaxID=3365979 RepID=UPI003812227D